MDRDNLLHGAAWGEPGAAVTHVETHAAHIYLVGNRAYKMKKAVKLPYLDFSTVEKRRAVLAHELEINRPFAPQIYAGLREIAGEPVLVMNRFAEQDVLARRVAREHVPDPLAAELARMAADMHGLAPAVAADGASIMTGLGAQLSAAFTASPDIFPPAQTLEFHALYEEALKRLTPLLRRRAEQGLVRRCHGDLHCGNIVVIGAHPVPFDAIEFSEKIGTIDVLYDLAFLLMDLWRHGEKRAANIVLNRYLHHRHGTEDGSGLAALPLFLATRAGVRALVTADLVHELPAGKSLYERGSALDFFRASIAFLKPAKPQLICIGGLSGTGKSTLAMSLAPGIGACPGAIHLRSDVERKRRAGIAETETLPPHHYSREESAAVYDALLARAEQSLAAGQSVIVDAVFADYIKRHAAEALARRSAAQFAGLWLEAPADMMKARVATRRGDASDADAGVIDRQLEYRLGPMTWTRLDSSGTAGQVLQRATGAIPAAPGAGGRRAG